MTQSLLAIAAFLTLIGGIIFGVKKFEKRSQTEEIEQVDKVFNPPDYAAKVDPMPSQVIEEAPANPVQTESSEPVVAEVSSTQPQEDVADPWNAEEAALPEEPTQTTLDLGEVASSPTLEQTDEETKVSGAIAGDQLSLDFTEDPDFIEPRDIVEEIVIAPTIQDPKRSNSDHLDHLSQEILVWGKTKDLKQVSKLNQYATHQDPVIRCHAAVALREVAKRHPLNREVESMIPVLGKLAQDSYLHVRQFAIQGLGEIRSQKVLPYLEQALRSPSNGVKRAAQSAIENLKLGYGTKPTSLALSNQPKKK